MVGFDLSRTPVMRFFENDELNADPGNWWAPNLEYLEAMLRTAGFADITIRRALTWTIG